jgi:large subunit ribosomal protein L24e
MEKKTCTFCGTDIEPGTGKMYVKKDGTKWNFCSNKCQKNLVVLKRVNRNVRWTKAFVKQPGPTPPKAGKKKSSKAAKGTAPEAQPGAAE